MSLEKRTSRWARNSFDVTGQPVSLVMRGDMPSNSALAGSERWEKELTWSFEKIARKIRSELFLQNRLGSGLVRFPALDSEKYLTSLPTYEDYAEWLVKRRVDVKLTSN